MADLRGGAPDQDPLDVQDVRDDGGQVAREWRARRRDVRDELRPRLRPHRIDVPGVDGLGGGHDDGVQGCEEPADLGRVEGPVDGEDVHPSVNPHGAAGQLSKHAPLGGPQHPR